MFHADLGLDQFLTISIFFTLHLHTFSQDDVTKKLDLLLIKSTLFQSCKEAVLLELIEDPPNDFDMALAWIFGINQNGIQIYNDKYIKLLN